jgi:outer membrane protein assembly factor BamB
VVDVAEEAAVSVETSASTTVAPADDGGVVATVTPGDAGSVPTCPPDAVSPNSGPLEPMLVGIDAASGARRWQVCSSHGGVATVVGEVDGLVVVLEYLWSQQHGIAAFDAASGERRWRVPLDGELGAAFPSAVAVAVADGVAVAAGVGTSTRAVDLATGAVRWTAEVGGSISIADGVAQVGDPGEAGSSWSTPRQELSGAAPPAGSSKASPRV